MAQKDTTAAEVKKDILFRVSLCFILVVVICISILGRAFYIQQVEGKYWREMSKNLHQKVEEIEADRGTIYSEDGQMLSTSIPQYDIYIDFGADGLREKSGLRFRENIDSLSYCLANLFKDYTQGEYKRMLTAKYQEKDRYFLLQRKISFRKYEALKKFPLVRLGRNKSGFIADDKSIRLNPYQMLAYRTIGLDRENSQKVGLEQTYDTFLKGTTGKQLVRYIAGGVSVPVDDSYQIQPENGKDIITTLDIHIQEITENALMKVMVENEALHGCAIVMETNTGKIKALANLGRRKDGTYWEDMNYALMPTEPGSTFKAATMLAVLEDKKATNNTLVDLEGGRWNISGRTVFDSEQHGKHEVTVKRAFELSSNVGMAKLVYNNYMANPMGFINHLKKLGFIDRTGIDLVGEGTPLVYNPKSKYWSNTTLPWMAFGYNLTISPLRTAMLYNTIANNGTMLKPYLVNAIREENTIIKTFSPTIIKKNIYSKETISQLQAAMVGVCTEPGSTGYQLFKGAAYTVAGKTGTAQVANGNRGYIDHIYQSSFAGYFPAEKPAYTIVVVIKNKPMAAKYYGALVAGPVFKEVADRLYTMYVRQGLQQDSITKKDSSTFNHIGLFSDLNYLSKQLKITAKDNTSKRSEFAVLKTDSNAHTIINELLVSEVKMPQLVGLKLKDAIYACERNGLQVAVAGKGKVITQSIATGANIIKGQKVNITLQ